MPCLPALSHAASAFPGDVRRAAAIGGGVAGAGGMMGAGRRGR
jgi:hypothetical protein